MRICVISPYYPPHTVADGIGDYTKKLYEEVVGLGHEVTVLVSYGYKAEAQPANRSIRIIPFTSRWDFGALLKLVRLCRREKYDVVNLQYSPLLYANIFKLFFPLIGFFCPTAVSLHTLIGGEAINKLVALGFILFCTKVISTNEEISYLIRKHLWWKKTLTQIPIGSNITPLKPDNPAAKNEEDRLILSHFGLFYPGKGVETILTAIAELKLEYDNFQLIMLGGEWRGYEYYYHDLQQQAHELGIDEYIRWLGYLPAAGISKYLSMTDIYLIPYDRGISIRRGSYMAGLVHGLPIISTYANIESAYIRDAENIALVPPQDPVALKEKILELIKNPAKRKQLGDNARALAAEFHWPNIAAKTICVFRKITR